jgi:predicted MFS family arabinose efflux permease
MSVTQDRKTNWTGVAFGLALASFAAFQQFKLPPVLPLLLERYGYERWLLGSFMGVYALAGLLLTLALARWIASRGAFPALWLALGLFLVANLATLAVPENGWLVLLARAAEGIAFAVCAVVGPATANGSASPRHLPVVIGATAAWIPLGQMAGALLAQPALDDGDWPLVWWAAVGATVLFAFWVWHLQASRSVALARGAGAPQGPGLTPAERRSLWIAGTAFLIFSGQYFAYMTWLPQYLIEVHGLAKEEALYAYLLVVAVLAIVNVIGGWLMRHGFDAAPMLAVGMALQAACWFLSPWTQGAVAGLISLFVYGVGAGLAPTALFAMPSRILGSGRPLVPAFGIIMTGRNVGVLLGPVVLAVLSEVEDGWLLSAPLFGGVSLVAVVLGLWLWRRAAAGIQGARR